MGKTGYHEICKGDRILLQNLDNSRYLMIVTSTINSYITGKRISATGISFGKVEKIKRWQYLCKENEEPSKNRHNLIPVDLIYDPYHRSGLQYGKAVLIRDDFVGIIRWNEPKKEWTKSPTHPKSYKIEFLGRADNPNDLAAFFHRVNTDREGWLSSPGRSRDVQINKEDSVIYGWREKQRRWQGEGELPVKFVDPIISPEYSEAEQTKFTSHYKMEIPIYINKDFISIKDEENQNKKFNLLNFLSKIFNIK